MRTYSDTQLINAVAASTSWRGVLRSLGLTATSASSMRSVRQHADRLALDYTHFRGGRRWTDEQLADAVAASGSWAQVAVLLGLAGGSAVPTLRGHAARLRIPTGHLTQTPPSPSLTGDPAPALANLRRAGTLLAAAWFELCGQSVSWPLEPCRYDLLVWRDTGAQRIQVKTTTFSSGNSWVARITSGGDTRTPYDPGDIDQFFIIDGDLGYYLIPVDVVGGLTTIRLTAYQAYRLPALTPATVESDTCQS